MASKRKRKPTSRHSARTAPDPEITADDEISALTALDLVRGRLAEIDALASSADDRIDAIPGRITDRDQRRRLGQLVELVVATAKATRAAVEEAERLAAAAMRAHTRTRGTARSANP